MSKLKKKHIDSLDWAIGEAETWRGSFEAEEARRNWDEWIAEASEALEIVKKLRKKKKRVRSQIESGEPQ